MDEYFELLTSAIERSMEKLDMVCKVAPNDPDDTKRKKISITSSDQTFIKAKKARNVVSLIENMLSRALQDMEEIQQDRKIGIKNSQQTLRVTTLIAHIQRAAPTRIQQANLVNQDMQEIIDDATDKELEAKQKTMTGLDPMDGTAVNKRRHLLSHADPDDGPIFEEMDNLLKENGITYNTISEEIQPPPQGAKKHDRTRPNGQNIGQQKKAPTLTCRPR